MAVAHLFSRAGDRLQRFASHLLILGRTSEDGANLVFNDHLADNDNTNDNDASTVITSRPRHNWTRQLIFNNLAIVIGTSFMSGFYVMAIARPYGLYPNDNPRNDNWFGKNQPVPQRKAAAVPLATLFFHHLLTYYSCRLFAYTGTASFFGTRFGRRKTLMLGATVGFFAIITGLISQLCSGKARDILWAISTGSLGLQNGIGQVIAPVFLIELAPVSIRGACGCFHDIFFWIGVALAFFAELDLPGNELALWTFILGASAAFYLLQFAMLWFGSESPHWLVHEADREQEALFVIKHLRQCDSENALAELNEIKEMAGNITDNNTNEPGCCMCPNNRSLSWELCKAKVVWPTFLCACLLSANLLTGVPIIYRIQTALLNKSDLVNDSVDDYHFPLALAVVLIVVYLTVMTIVALFLVDTVGRRRLINAGMSLMTIAYLPIAIGTYYKDATTWQVGTVLFMASYSLGPGPVAGFMSAELFDHRSRLITNSVGHFVTQLFPVYLAEIYDNDIPYRQLFMPAGIIFCVLELVILWLFLPETKQQLFHHIVAKFRPEQTWLQIFDGRRSWPLTQQNNNDQVVMTATSSSSSSVAPYFRHQQPVPANVTSIQMQETLLINSSSSFLSSNNNSQAATFSLDDDGDVNTI